LFEGIEEGTEIKEYELGGTERIFFYIDNGEKIVNCILIKNAHIEY
jgi:hypothetical protein